jgi:hypothetical protein
MMIIKIHDSIIAQPTIASQRRHVEEILHVHAVRARRLARNPPQLLAFDMGPPLFAQPVPTAEMTEVLPGAKGLTASTSPSRRVDTLFANYQH